MVKEKYLKGVYVWRRLRDDHVSVVLGEKEKGKVWAADLLGLENENQGLPLVKPWVALPSRNLETSSTTFELFLFRDLSSF